MFLFIKVFQKYHSELLKTETIDPTRLRALTLLDPYVRMKMYKVVAPLRLLGCWESTVGYIYIYI